MSYLFYAALLLFTLAGLSGTLAPWLGASPPAEAVRRDAAQPDAAKPGGGNVMYVTRKGGGQYYVDALIAGKSVRFLIDTGASLVALTAEDSERLGIAPQMHDATLRLRTANGVVEAPSIRLASIVAGPLAVQDVEAVVMPRGQLAQSLLGMTFLSRLRRYEFRSGHLIMEQ